MAETDKQAEIEKDRQNTQLRLMLLREELGTLLTKIEFELSSFYQRYNQMIE
jgi:hypothetical protein